MDIASIQIDDPAYRRLVALDPNFAWLLHDAQRHGIGRRDYCALDAWDEEFRQRVADIAGWNRAYGGPDELRRSDAYETACRVINAALPACRGNCGCGEARAAS